MQYLKRIPRPGLGQGGITGGITDAMVGAVTPALENIVQNEVMPMALVGIVAGSIAAAVVGSWFATRHIRKAQMAKVIKNPGTFVRIRRRRS